MLELIGDSKLPRVVNGCLCLYVSPVIDRCVPKDSHNDSWDRINGENNGCVNT